MTPHLRRLFLLLVALLLATTLPIALLADDAPPDVQDAWVEEALEAAGDHRAELEKALAHYTAENDPDGLKRIAVRFLVANMPGRGYVVTVLQDEDGTAIPFDPTDYPNYEAAREAIEGIERECGEIGFSRERLVKDIETVTAEYLIHHVDLAFEAWRRVPASCRVDFPAFLECVLPYRGSQEPIDTWLDPLMRRYADIWRKAGEDADPAEIYRRVCKQAHERVRFDSRYYMHPTDQGFTEMVRSGLGRCEDITNMITFTARSVGLATAADFTPAWGHTANNHAWNVLLGRDGKGFDPAQSRAAKIYRKTFSIQRDALPFRLPEGRKAPNRFLASKTIRDVTRQYGETTDVTVQLDPARIGEETFAYLCVFNAGDWVALAWSEIHEGQATFEAMGRDLLYLPAVHDGETLIPAGPPFLIEKDGHVVLLPGTGAKTTVLLTSLKPRQKSADTHVETPVSYLEKGKAYRLQVWTEGKWKDVERFEAGDGPKTIDGVSSDALYWLVAEESRRLERPFVIEETRQRFR